MKILFGLLGHLYVLFVFAASFAPALLAPRIFPGRRRWAAPAAVLLSWAVFAVLVFGLTPALLGWQAISHRPYSYFYESVNKGGLVLLGFLLPLTLVLSPVVAVWRLHGNPFRIRLLAWTMLGTLLAACTFAAYFWFILFSGLGSSAGTL